MCRWYHTKILIPFMPFKWVNGQRRDSVTRRKNVTENELMRKWMVEFPRKVENCGIKIAHVDLIRNTKYINWQ